MTDQTIDTQPDFVPASTAGPYSRPNPVMGYAASIGLVAVAGIAAFIVENIVPNSDLALVFVLPVLLSAISFGWRPALVSALVAVGVFDFFFVEPLYSLRVTSPSDMWSLGLLLVVAAIASTAAAQSRRRAIDARLAADRAEALHGLAHQVVETASATGLTDAAAAALSRIFRAPAVVLIERTEGLKAAALAGGAALSAVDSEAAQWALTNQTATKAGTYPFDGAEFDFWPIKRGNGQGIVLGAGATAGGNERPADPGRYVEMVGAYLAAGLAQGDRAAHGV